MLAPLAAGRNGAVAVGQRVKAWAYFDFTSFSNNNFVPEKINVVRPASRDSQNEHDRDIQNSACRHLEQAAKDGKLAISARFTARMMI